MLRIAFTGPRRLNESEKTMALLVVNGEAMKTHKMLLNSEAVEWQVGDAFGLDTMVFALAQKYNIPISVYRVKAKKGQAVPAWAFAKRSEEMIDALNPGDRLLAFPNKECPLKCIPSHPFSGHGSGTWGTCAYCKSKAIDIEVHRLGQFELPDWLSSEQLSLFA